MNETLNMTDLLRRSGLVDAFSESSDAVYRLTGYLNHRGKTTHAGHYTASVAYPKPDDPSSVDWFEFDDSVVNNMTSIVDTEGSKERHGKILRSRDAYMLLYVRVDSADASTTASPAPPVLPATECLDEITTLNAVFDTDVSEYVERAEALEARIQSRLDAYHAFFETEPPAPAPDAQEFYWVDTSWLRSWVVGEETQPQTLGYAVPVKRETDGSQESAPANGTRSDSTASNDRDSEMKPAPHDASAGAPLDSRSDSSSALSLRVDSSRGADIPFAKPLDMVRFCCIHGLEANRARAKKPGVKASSFAPENVNKLKRVSARLFEHLRATCGVASSTALLSPTGESRRSRRTSDPIDAGVVFDASSFRCRECEAEFCNKLLDDAELLRQIELEMQLLKTPSQPDDPNPHLMSRAWIASYKTHLQELQKQILHKPSKKGGASKAKRTAASENSHDRDVKDATESSSTTGAVPSAAALDDKTRDVWRNGLNEDIVCDHGQLFLKKKKYRAVPEATWVYFSQKFPSHFAFEERTAEPCSQCQVAEAASEEVFQVERACRDDVLSRAPLARLYRRKPSESGTTFALRNVFLPTASAAGEQRKMFLVPRTWMLLWREYIRDVEHESPPSLTCLDLMCVHNKLLLPQSVLMSSKGEAVDAASVDVEFVSRDEMAHLAELYGVPHCLYFYGQLQADDVIEWRCCSFAAIVGHDTIDAVDASELYPDAHANCLECEKISEIQHLDELENFQSRAVHVHLLAPDQAVPTTEKLSVETSASGRQRRSKRIRSGASGAHWAIFANSSDSVYVLKTKVYEEIDAYPIRQRLYFKGTVLEDRLTLKECGYVTAFCLAIERERLVLVCVTGGADADDHSVIGTERRRIKAGDAVFMRLSDETPDEAALGDDDALEREVGFEDSVFLRHASAEPSRVWVCTACTFVNEETDLVCEMCATEIA